MNSADNKSIAHDTPTSSNHRFLAAKNWIDTLFSRNQWRVQLLQQKFKASKDGGRKTLPFRIRRFAEGCPPTSMKEAMDYLLSLAPYSGVVFNGQPIDGEYRPTKTEWRRDDGDVINNRTSAKSVDGTYTLVQDLIEKDADDSYGAGSSASCTEEVVTEWHWDEDSIEDLPPPEQGVTWAIVGVNRSDDGTFSYSLVKRVAKHQHTPLHTVKSTATETVTSETHRNLYGEPWDFRDETGAAVTVRQSGCLDGSLVETQLKKNDDCTYDATTSTTTGKTVLVADESRHTQFEGEHEKSAMGLAAPLDNAPDASGGVIKKNTSTLQPDGRFSVKEHTVKERKVASSKETWEVTLAGIRHTVVDTNVSSPAAAITSFTRESIGTVVSNDKTPGKLYVVTKTGFVKAPPMTTGGSCSKTVFEHRDSSLSTDPDATADVHVTNAGGGKYFIREARLTDSGTMSVTESTVNELPVRNSEVTKTRSVKSIVTEIVHKNVSDSVSSADVPAKPGGMLRHVTNPGGSHDYTVRTVKLTGFVDRARNGNTVFLSTVDDVKVTDTATVDSSLVTRAGNGHYYDKTSTVDNDGLVTTVVTDNCEKQFASAEKEVRRIPRAIIMTVTDRNTNTTCTTTASSLGNGCSERHSANPGGTYNFTRTTVVPTATRGRMSCSNTVFQHVHVHETANDVNNVTDADARSAGGGHTYSKEETVDSTYGIRTVTETYLDEIHVQNAKVDSASTYFTKTKSATDANMQSYQHTPCDFVQDGGGTTTQKSLVVNPGGSSTVTETTVTAKTRTWDDSPDEIDNRWFYKAKHVRNGERSALDAACNEFGTTLNSKIQDWNSKGIVSHPSISYSSTKNDFGLLDGTVAVNVTLGKKARMTCSKTIFKHVHVKETKHDSDDVDYEKDQSTISKGDGKTVDREETIDPSCGMRTVVETTTEELEVDKARLDYSSTHFTKTSVETKENAKSPDQAVIDYVNDGAGKIETKTCTVNPGGSTTVTKTKVEAMKREWEEPEVSLNKLYRTVWHCRNAKRDEFKSKFSALKSTFESKVKSWDSEGRSPSRVSITPSSTLNDFGLVDGTITVEAVWSPDSAGQTGEVDKVFTDKTWWAWAMHQQYNMGKDGVMTVRLEKSAKQCHLVIGRGTRNWDNFMASHKDVIEGSHFAFHPSTVMYDALVYEKLKVASITGTVSSGTTITPG